jgi:hypothetical protein
MGRKDKRRIALVDVVRSIKVDKTMHAWAGYLRIEVSVRNLDINDHQPRNKHKVSFPQGLQ